MSLARGSLQYSTRFLPFRSLTCVAQYCTYLRVQKMGSHFRVVEKAASLPPLFLTCLHGHG